MSTFERILTELGEGLGIDLAPGSDGVAEVAAEGRIVLLKADETGEREVLVFATVATAPAGGFPAGTLRTALEMDLFGRLLGPSVIALDLFGRDVAGHHLGLFAGSLLLSATLPLDGLSAEGLAERILVVSRLAGELSGRLAAADAPASADPGPSGLGGGFLAV